MSLKLIELQIALPRTQEAGQIQSQLETRGQHMQEILADAARKENEQKQHQVPRNNKNEGVQLNKEHSSNEYQHQKRKNKTEKELPHEEKENHPYKGKSIDFRG